MVVLWPPDADPCSMVKIDACLMNRRSPEAMVLAWQDCLRENT